MQNLNANYIFQRLVNPLNGTHTFCSSQFRTLFLVTIIGFCSSSIYMIYTQHQWLETTLYISRVETHNTKEKKSKLCGKCVLGITSCKMMNTLGIFLMAASQFECPLQPCASSPTRIYNWIQYSKKTFRTYSITQDHLQKSKLGSNEL